MIYITSISSKGQITVPAALRRQLKVGAGDRLRVEARKGELIIAPDTYDAELSKLRSLAKKHLAERGLTNLPLKEIKKRSEHKRTQELKRRYGLRAR